MRDYSKVSPRFWTGETGKQIKARGIEAQMLALYLQTSPHANMLGLYYLPIPFICHETGLSNEGALKALQSLSEVGFCAYDEASEHVFVFKMAEWQVGPSLAENDNRVKGIRKDFAALPNNPFLNDFYTRYSERFHLEEQPKEGSPSEAPSKPGAVTGAVTGAGEKKEPPIPPKGDKPSSPVGVKAFLDNCTASGELPIPEDDPVFDYAKKTKIPREFLNLCFREFVERNIDSGKRYKDWRKAFRNCVRSNWYKLWYADQASGQMVLTTTGVQAQRKHKEAA